MFAVCLLVIPVTLAWLIAHLLLCRVIGRNGKTNHCAQCNYNLAGLSTSVPCPECSSTLRWIEHRRTALWKFSVPALVAVCAFGWTITLVAYSIPTDTTTALGLATVLWSCYFATTTLVLAAQGTKWTALTKGSVALIVILADAVLFIDPSYFAIPAIARLLTPIALAAAMPFLLGKLRLSAETVDTAALTPPNQPHESQQPHPDTHKTDPK